jgi:hypothetical protein
VTETLLPAERAAEFIARKKKDVGKFRPMKDIGRDGILWWESEAWTLRQETGDNHKIAFIERLRLKEITGKRFRGDGSKVGAVEYRVGYYIVNRKGKWHFGQFALMLPTTDLLLLLQQARDEGTLLADLYVQQSA